MGKQRNRKYGDWRHTKKETETEKLLFFLVRGRSIDPACIGWIGGRQSKKE